MKASLQQTALRRAWPLVAAIIVVAPAPSQAATGSASVETRLAPILASAPHLAGPLRLLAAYGTPTSAWRSAEHNKRVGGASNSYHLLGHAIDVQRRPGVTHRMLDSALRRAGYLVVESLDEIDHSHFAFLPGRIALKPSAPAAPIAPAPEKPPEPRVAADNHGTLLIDAARSDVRAPPIAAPVTQVLASAR